MSFEYKKILNLHAKYIDYLLEKTHLSHQGMRNINLCGSEVESEIRSFMQNLIPERFKVTHGYILYAPDNESEPRVSPQVDLILVDTLVTHNIFTLDKNNGMEIVPVEAVVGVFEIKRTLNSESFRGAVEQLKEIINTVNIPKSDKTEYLPGGIRLEGLQSSIYSNPLIGIISLDHDKTYFDNKVEMAQEIFKRANDSNLDFISSLSGMLILPMEEEGDQFLVLNFRDKEDQYYAYLNQSNATQVSIISRFIGYICAYLAQCTGRKVNVWNYFFNKTTWEKIN